MQTEQDLRHFVASIDHVSHERRGDIQKKLNNLTKPLGSLGFLEDSVLRLGLIQGTIFPKITQKRVYTFAGDHGIANESVSAYPSSVTRQMVLNFLNGGAAINVLAKQFELELKIIDSGVNHDFGDVSGLIKKKIAMGTKNFLNEPAMTREQAVQSILMGIELSREAKEEGVDLIIAGDMGIGNTTSSSAITSVLCQKSVEEVTGIGTGVSDSGLRHKVSVIKQSLERRSPDSGDPLDILTKVGGFEIGAITGLALGCAKYKIPLISDGFISTTGVALGYSFNSVVRDILFPVECTSETGNKHLLNFLNLSPVLSLDVRLGEGTGAALFVPMLESALSLYNNMATFESAGVDNREQTSS